MAQTNSSQLWQCQFSMCQSSINLIAGSSIHRMGITMVTLHSWWSPWLTKITDRWRKKLGSHFCQLLHPIQSCGLLTILDVESVHVICSIRRPVFLYIVTLRIVIIKLYCKHVICKTLVYVSLATELLIFYIEQTLQNWFFYIVSALSIKNKIRTSDMYVHICYNESCKSFHTSNLCEILQKIKITIRFQMLAVTVPISKPVHHCDLREVTQSLYFHFMFTH